MLGPGDAKRKVRDTTYSSSCLLHVKNYPIYFLNGVFCSSDLTWLVRLLLAVRRSLLY